MAIDPASVVYRPPMTARAVGLGKEVSRGNGRVEEGPQMRSASVDSPTQVREASRVAVREEVGLEAPPGTDPQLWSVLTTEERRYFAQLRALGPLTYRPGRLGLVEFALQRGGRLDVRV